MWSFKSFIERTLTAGKRKFVINFSSKLVADIMRIFFQVGYFALLARHLGPALFGDFAVLIAVCRFAVPLVTLGLPMVMALDVAKDKEQYKRYLGTSYILVIFFTSVFTITIWILRPFIGSLQRIDVSSIGLLLIASELFVEGIRITLTSLYQAVDRLYISSSFELLQSLLRLLALLFFIWIIQKTTLTLWAVTYALANLVFIGAYFFYSFKDGFINLKWSFNAICHSFRMGISFSLGSLSRAFYTDFDKLLISNMIGSTTAGIYIAGYRIVALNYLPITAYLAAIYPHLLRQGGQGQKMIKARAMRLGPIAFGLGFVMSLIVWLFGPLAISILLGNKYREASKVVRLLAFLLFLQGFHMFFGDLLTSERLQPLRAVIQIIIMVINILLSFWWIKLWGWQGAAYATLSSEFALGLVFFTTFLIFLQ